MQKHIIILHLILLCFSATATSIIPFKDINHLSGSSHCIYLATAISTGEQTNNGITHEYTVFEVQEVIKGEVIQQFKIKSENLRKGDESFIVAGNPNFELNESYLLFLKDSQDDFKSPICMSYYIFQEKIINGEKLLAPSQNEHFHIVGKSKQINAVYKQKEFLIGLKSITKKNKISQEQLQSFVSTHKIKDAGHHHHKSAPSHCNHLPREEDSPNDRRRSRIENAEAQPYPVYYSSTGSGCSDISNQVARGIAHLNSNYAGINFDFKGSFTGFTQNPNCVAGNISQDTRDFIDQNYPEYNGRAALIHFNDPCNQLTGENAGVIAVGGSWLTGSHNFQGENFRTAKYGRVIVNVGMAELCNRNSVSSQFTDYELMIAHELTHVAGLDHIKTSDGDANMNPSLRSTITDLDILCMADLYPVVAPQADLRVDIDPTSISFSGLTMTISDVKIINEGNRTAGSSKLAYYLSTDTNITNSDILISEQDVVPIASGQTIQKTLTVDLSNFAITGGQYKIGAIIDSNSDVSESDENNNTWILTNGHITLPNINPRPDFSLECGTVTMDGLTITVANTIVKNIGSRENTESVNIGFYLSTNSTISTNDRFIGFSEIGSLEANDQSTFSFSKDLNDENIPLGRYFLGIIVDYDQKIDELRESNNSCRTSSNVVNIITIEETKPDLTVTCGNVSINGSTVSISNVRIANDGNAISTAGRIVYYLSDDQTITRDDTPIGFYNHVAIPAGESLLAPDKSVNVKTSSINVSDGVYYFGTVADYTSSNDESNENNNTCVKNASLTVGSKPDLTVECGSATVVGTNIQIENVVVRNIGNQSSHSSKVGFYLTNDQIATDVKFGDRIVGILNPNTSSTKDLTVDIASLNLDVGTYSIRAVADFENKIQESSENNNSCEIENATVEIIDAALTGPDLTIDCGTASFINNKLKISNVTSSNVGDQTSGTCFIGFYLSLDENISADQNLENPDYYIGTDFLGSLNAGGSETELPHVVDLNLSAYDHIPNGNYFVGAVVDYKNNRNEANENNNSCMLTTPKITISDSQAADGDFTVHCSLLNVNDDSKIIMSAQVRNEGTGIAGIAEIGYYISPDNHITTDDILVGTDELQKQLNPGDLENHQVTIIKADLNLSAGEYYVGAIVDHLSSYMELDETNNFCVSSTGSISIGKETVEGADLIVSCGTYTVFENLVRTNGNIVLNQGNAKAGNVSRLGYYISSDKIITSADQYLAQDYVYDLDPGDISTENQTLYIDYSKLSAGTYYVGMIADHQNVTDEPSANKHNNSCIIEDLEIEVLNNFSSKSESRNLTITPPLDNQDNFDITVYPNPVQSDSDFIVDIGTVKDQQITLEIYNQLGESVFAKRFSKISETDHVKIKNQSLSKGTYFLRVTTESNMLVSKFLVIE